MVSVAIGGFAVSTSFDSDVARVDDALAVAANQVSRTNGDPIGSALLAAEQSAVSLTVDFLTLNGDFLSLNPGGVDLNSTPSKVLLNSAIAQAVTVYEGASSTYRLRVVALPDEEWLLAHEAKFSR